MNTPQLVPPSPPKPRWARGIDDETWDRLNDLVIKGWTAPVILRELSIPPCKTRSLQVYARKFAARRRVAHFEIFKDALASAGMNSAAQFSAALTRIAEIAASESAQPIVQVRAFAAITEFTRVLSSLMQHDVKASKDRYDDPGSTRTPQADDEVLAEAVRKIYGVEIVPGNEKKTVQVTVPPPPREPDDKPQSEPKVEVAPQPMRTQMNARTIYPLRSIYREKPKPWPPPRRYSTRPPFIRRV